ncbi:MAG TPA: glucose-6-phosphate isomerase [Firmicutes bacterium]|nr:glucose-6-phosphate isomerase [Bacillota bacterium]
MIKVDLSHLGFKLEENKYKEKVAQINKAINEKTLPGNDYLGWANYPYTYNKEEFERIKKDAKYIKENYDCLVVAGIGGSYLGARAAIEAINGLFKENSFPIIFMGQTFSSKYVHQVLKMLEGKKFAINVISKSGTTTETSIAFRLLREQLEKQIGKEEAAKAIFATTDAKKGALLELCKKYGYERFVLPDDVGGRYSVFTAVGLLPMAVAGIDIDEFMLGAKEGKDEYDTDSINEAYKYALARHYLYKEKGYPVEMFVTYEPNLVQLGEWWKQLYGESEGKDSSGLLPDSATFTTDLHSLGQFIQEGSKVLFETVLNIEESKEEVIIPNDDDNLDGLNYLNGKSLEFVSKKAMEGTLLAHSKTGKVPNIVINMSKMDSKELGHLLYFFMRACAMSAYLNNVNAFNQPGVEIYKKNMFHLLGKPGF